MRMFQLNAMILMQKTRVLVEVACSGLFHGLVSSTVRVDWLASRVTWLLWKQNRIPRDHISVNAQAKAR